MKYIDQNLVQNHNLDMYNDNESTVWYYLLNLDNIYLGNYLHNICLQASNNWMGKKVSRLLVQNILMYQLNINDSLNK